MERRRQYTFSLAGVVSGHVLSNKTHKYVKHLLELLDLVCGQSVGLSTAISGQRAPVHIHKVAFVSSPSSFPPPLFFAVT